MTSRVLIVDDSLTVRMDLVEAFASAGFASVPCATLTEARSISAREPIALIVLDVLLPDGDGLEWLRELRAQPALARIPVLLLSTEAEVKDRIRGLQTGADDYVGKPYDPAYLVARAKEVLRGRQGAEAERATVLVVDDSATYREALRAAFEQAGYAVLTASSGEEGLRVAAASRPHALVVDGIMPGLDGSTVIRKIRMDPALRRTPCVLLTASDEDGEELHALEAGADAFVRKDEDSGVVLARLGAVLRGAAAQRADTASLLGPMRILAVDDSPTYLNELADTLRGEGYDVVVARSGEAALDMLAAQAVDCILLDVMMPGLDGLETCRRIKSSPVVRDTPLIMLTAIEDRDAMIDGLSTGADDFISKSSEVNVLKARVRAQLRRKQFEDEHRRTRDELHHTALEASEQRAARAVAETRAALVDQLERTNQELEAFSYSVSHDLRAPLRTIDGFANILLLDHAEEMSGDANACLQRIRAAAQRMGELIDDLLELSRVGRTELVRSDIDLGSLARLVVEELARAQPDRKVAVKIEPSVVHGDPRLLKVLLENLLGNAWKFTSKVAAPEIELGTEQDGDASVHFVRDNGAGFDPRYAQKLFAPFQRLHTETEFPGTGIGLATVRRILERHGGRIWARSAVGEGATFFFTVPG
jgi:DNA-binding response OmpR family regulator